MMTVHTPARRLALAAAAVALLALPACGLTGDLKRGKPVFSKPEGETAPAELPSDDKSNLPPLPERKPVDTSAPPNADDELLGGPGG